jgi:HK97 family phage major capsid protein
MAAVTKFIRAVLHALRRTFYRVRLGMPIIAGGAPTLEELESRQSEIRELLKDIDQEFAGEVLPEDRRKEWNDLNGEFETNAKTIAELKARHQRVQELAEAPGNTEDGSTFHTRPNAARGDDIYDLTTIRMSVSSPEEATRELRDRAMRSIESARFPHERAEKERCQAHIERLLERVDTKDGALARHLLATGSPTYKRAFSKAIAGHPLSNEEQRVLSIGGAGGAEGGYAVPYTLDPTIIPTSNSSINPWRAISRIESIVGSNEWRGVSSGAVSATRVAEATEATDQAPALAQPTAAVTKAHTFIPFSVEVGADWGALETEMARLIQDAKDDEEATAFATGAGTTVNPQGVITGATNTVAAATGLTVTAANLYALEAALPPRFRPNEVFVANRAIYNVVRGIDTAGGAALWLYLSQGLASEVPRPGNTGALLLGRPAYESSAMVSAIANAAKIMIVGDFSYFLIVDRIGLTVEVVPHLFGGTANYPTGQRGLYAYWRNTSKVLSANAFRVLTGTT